MVEVLVRDPVQPAPVDLAEHLAGRVVVGPLHRVLLDVDPEALRAEELREPAHLVPAPRAPVEDAVARLDAHVHAHRGDHALVPVRHRGGPHPVGVAAEVPLGAVRVLRLLRHVCVVGVLRWSRLRRPFFDRNVAAERDQRHL